MDKLNTEIFSRFKSSPIWDKLELEKTGILCAWSTGYDSSALLDLLHSLSAERKFNLVAAHFNHQLRDGESDADEDFAVSTAADMGLKLVTGHGNVREEMDKTGASMEMAARSLRYNFLETTARSENCSIIATGHNINDRTEMLIMRLLRGSGGRGLGALKQVTEKGGFTHIKPLLEFTRDEILAHLAKRGISAREDSSNKSLTTDRNIIRNSILPAFVKLAEENGFSSVEESIARSAELLTKDDDFLTLVAKEGMDAIVRFEDHSMTFMSEIVDIYDSSILGRVILIAMEKFDPEARLERIHIEHIENLMRGTIDKKMNIPGGYFAEQRNGSVIVGIEDEIDVIEKITVDVNLGTVKVNFGQNRIIFSVLEKSEGGTIGEANSAYLDYKTIGWKLIVRTYETGDRIDPLGMEGHTRKLSDIFTDNKISRRNRIQIPIILSAKLEKLVAIPTLGLISEHCKITDESDTILKISVD
jgi:tRNA(Ile)-lysidine synthase